jgi:hypothetical protein
VTYFLSVVFPEVPGKEVHSPINNGFSGPESEMRVTGQNPPLHPFHHEEETWVQAGEAGK